MGHIHINGRHHMGSPFHHRYLKALLCQILRHLKADKPGSYDSAGHRIMLRNIIMDRIGIRYIPQGKHMILFHARDSRTDRACAW